MLLLKQMQLGDENAFTTIYLHYSPLIYPSVLKIVKDEEWAEEICQELFTKLWLKKERLCVENNFSGYLFTIAHRLVIDHFRKVKRDRRFLDHFIQMAGEYIEWPDSLSDAKQNYFLQRAIDRLPPQQKKVFQLIRIEGHTYKKAAVMLGISPHTVKEYLALTTKSIKTYLIGKTTSRSLILFLLWYPLI